MPMILKSDPANHRAVMQAMLMRELQREANIAILLNPWIWAPDPMIHSLRWVRQRGIAVIRWKPIRWKTL